MIPLLLLAPLLRRQKPSTAVCQLPKEHQVKLPNGLSLHHLPYRNLPLVEVELVIPGGSRLDPTGKEGLANLVAKVLTKGTKGRNATEISETIDFLGANLDVEAGHDYIAVSAEFLVQDLDEMLSLLAEIVMLPAFPPEEVGRACRQVEAQIEQIRDEPERLIQRHFSRLLFGEHPYGRPVLGWERSLCTITREDLAAFHRATFRPDEAILAIVGDLDAVTAQEKVTEIFSAWRGEGAVSPPPVFPPPERVSGRKIHLIDKPDATQTQILIGNLGVSRSDPDYFPLLVANTLFGGAFTSRLNRTIRVERSLSYGAWSSFQFRKERGAFLVGTYTKTETTREALEVVLEELARLHREGVTDAEVRRAKSYLAGQFSLKIEPPEARAYQLAMIHFFGLPEDYMETYPAHIEAVSIADVERVIHRHFPLDDLLIVLLGKADEIEPGVRDLGEVNRRDLLDH
ncbi:MAG: insulinase family protein [Deltaproteobacteria bacterium]|nr:MAG: insulinase family protein [Deltaproteobacteria bacterium]